ncbi:MAG: tetratricopeptide repeat protein, partial [Aliifodinibius sp.]|nr:tetratricopeptide repeat protein [Fodinibius sp.]NIV13109.1 tetratricopeptide repeat protein [Fodinibius sp.]NIY26780.1 tetratricopeptide repeat protein [Fodinibius sp.]
MPKLFVIARNSVFTYKGKPVKVKQVAEDLGVKFVLEGSIRKAGDKIRITAQLIDAISGHHLWAERYDRNLKEIFDVQDELTKNIITAMQVKLTEGEQVRVAAKGTNNLEAFLKYLQAVAIVRQFNIESNALAKQLAQDAIALDPEYAMAYIVLSSTHRMDVWLGTSKSPKESIAKNMALIQKAIDLDPTYAEAYGQLGFTYSMIGKHDKAVAKAEQAVALNPNSAYVHMLLGHTLRFADRFEEAIPEYKKAIRLNPIPPTNYLFGLGLAYCWTGQYEEAIKWCEKAVRQDPESFLTRLMMTMVYSESG